VPANCTGKFQPCDGGIQQPLKLALKHTEHEDIIKEILQELEKDTISRPDSIKLSKSLPVLHDWSTQWINEAFHKLNISSVVKQLYSLFILINYFFTKV
jgi:hypothetical protein